MTIKNVEVFVYKSLHVCLNVVKAKLFHMGLHGIRVILVTPI